jgi:hypothetical protein
MPSDEVLVSRMYHVPDPELLYPLRPRKRVMQLCAPTTAEEPEGIIKLYDDEDLPELVVDRKGKGRQEGNRPRPKVRFRSDTKDNSNDGKRNDKSTYDPYPFSLDPEWSDSDSDSDSSYCYEIADSILEGNTEYQRLLGELEEIGKEVFAPDFLADVSEDEEQGVRPYYAPIAGPSGHNSNRRGATYANTVDHDHDSDTDTDWSRILRPPNNTSNSDLGLDSEADAGSSSRPTIQLNRADSTSSSSDVLDEVEEWTLTPTGFLSSLRSPFGTPTESGTDADPFDFARALMAVQRRGRNWGSRVGKIRPALPRFTSYDADIDEDGGEDEEDSDFVIGTAESPLSP